MTMFSSLISEIQDATESGLTKRQLRALTRITNLFVAGSGRRSNKQIELFDEVFKTLVAAIELETRVKLARRLATDPDAPATLVRAFAFDDAIAVAAPVLSQSTALSDADLVASASTQSQGHLQAIAHRRTISEAITEILIERGIGFGLGWASSSGWYAPPNGRCIEPNSSKRYPHSSNRNEVGQ